MRPVLLEIDGFGSFRDPVTLDFTDADYFALVGPTGAGKSTVIDAMSFALYGSVHRWDNPHLVKYALAPTANRATVRLVFDVGPARYVVAREVRRSGAGMLPTKGRLERLTDPSGLGGAGDITEVLAADKAVTPAVETLLGLTFEQFCTCVVLPQGDFADFLHASRSDRQKILLKLLGADRYDAIARAANSSAAAARQREAVLAEQLATYADATADAEVAAADRERQLRVLEDHLVSVSLPGLAAAQDQLAAAEADLRRLESRRRLLADVTIPAGVHALDADLAAAAAAQARAAEAERRSQAADTAAREAVAAGPARAPLEQARRDHAERSRISAELPAAERACTAAAQALATASAGVLAAATDLEQARTAKDLLAKRMDQATALLQQLSDERAQLAAVAIPGSLTELDGRAGAASDDLRRSAKAEAEADEADAAARGRLAAGPARNPLEQALTRLTELADLEQRLPAMTAAIDLATAEQAGRTDALAAADGRLEAARAAREAAAQAHQAADLRDRLTAGAACPVCDQAVLVLPPPLHAPELAAADAAVGAAETAVRDAQRAERAAAVRLHQARADHDRLSERIGGLRESLAGYPGGAAAVRAELDGLDQLESTARAAADALSAARRSRISAQQLADAVERDLARARAELQSARDPLVQLGAPPGENADLLGAWTALAGWAHAAAADRAARLTPTEREAAELTAELRQARRRFAAAEREAEERREVERTITGTAARAGTELERLRNGLSALTETLGREPAEAVVLAALAELDRLESAVRDCDTTLIRARAARAAAEQAVTELAAQVSSGWQQLRASRDRLVELGAPSLPDDQLLAAWTTLATWAESQLAAGAAALATASAQVSAMAERCASLGTALAAELAEHDITAPDGELAAAARPAVAAAVQNARNARERIAERRQTAARLSADRDTAATAAQVAKTLGDLLSANNFQRWLAASALDTLLIDASANLMALSRDQFEMTHDQGELVVVDHADADSQRPVKTLSGGETFQASLALALALSAQLSSLSADGGAARLDSIFLDEGFGTLDETALETVASTLENLAHGDRMVGVITHVRALAERVPVRFEVSRDERTSTLIRAAAWQ